MKKLEVGQMVKNTYGDVLTISRIDPMPNSNSTHYKFKESAIIHLREELTPLYKSFWEWMKYKGVDRFNYVNGQVYEFPKDGLNWRLVWPVIFTVFVAAWWFFVIIEGHYWFVGLIGTTPLLIWLQRHQIYRRLINSNHQDVWSQP